MTHHKRKRRRGAAVCGLCKPHKRPGSRKAKKSRTIQERRAPLKQICGMDYAGNIIELFLPVFPSVVLYDED